MVETCQRLLKSAIRWQTRLQCTRFLDGNDLDDDSMVVGVFGGLASLEILWVPCCINCFAAVKVVGV